MRAAIATALILLLAVRAAVGGEGLAAELLEADPDSPLAWQYRAYALHRMGLEKQAEEAYERTLQLAPGNAWAWRNLAELYALAGRYGEAVPAAERAVEVDPTEQDGWTRFTRILRESGDYSRARSVAERARKAGISEAWCEAALGYVTWALGDSDASRGHWRAARAAGADAKACDHDERIADWDRPAGPRSKREAIEARRLGEGDEWVFPVGSIEVHTRVGPELPRDLGRLIVRLQDEYDRFLAVGETWGGTTRLFLSRTIEEHERHRERIDPQGFSGRAFFVPARGRWRRGRDRGGRPSLDLYVAYSSPGLCGSLSHELAHVLVHGSLPHARNLPVWLDEGIATYLELIPDEKGRWESRTIRADLLATLRGAENPLPLRTLLSAQREAFLGPDGRERYAEAWSLFCSGDAGRGSEPGLRICNR